MGRRGDVPTRREAGERVDRNQDDMREKEREEELVVSDVETVRGTEDALDFGGTEEGAEALERAMESAEDTTIDVFEEKDGELEGIQGESDEHQQELDERSDVGEADIGKVSDARGRVDTDETNDKLSDAEDAIQEDIEFLDGLAERTREAREESERVQQEHQSRVRSGRRR